jgi:hypothetical protein
MISGAQKALLPKSPSHPVELSFQLLREDSSNELMLMGGAASSVLTRPRSSFGFSGPDSTGPIPRTSSSDSVFSPRKKPPVEHVNTDEVDHLLTAPHHELKVQVPGTGPAPHTQFKNEQADKTVLVVAPATAKPFRFRTTRDDPVAADEYIDRRGYEDVPMAGFGALGCEEQVETIKKKAAAQYGAQGVVIIDARQESHAVLKNKVGDSYSLTLFSVPDNIVNMGFVNQEASARQQRWINNFQLHHSPVVEYVPAGDMKKYVGAMGKPASKDYLHEILIGVRPSIKTEEEMVKACGVDYFPLYVSDRQRMSDENLEAFIDYINRLPEDTFYGVHCKAGRGRTTSAMLLIDMHRNAAKVYDDGTKVSRRDFILRNEIIGATLFKPANNGKADRQLMREERGLFLCHAHAYFERYPQGRDKTWRQFLAEDVPHMNLDFSAEMMMIRGEAKTWEEADALCKAAPS